MKERSSLLAGKERSTPSSTHERLRSDVLLNVVISMFGRPHVTSMRQLPRLPIPKNWYENIDKNYDVSYGIFEKRDLKMVDLMATTITDDVYEVRPLVV